MSALIVGFEFLTEVEAMVIAVLNDFEKEMVEAMVDNRSLSYGDLPLEPSERILKFLDDSTPETPGGLSIMDAMQSVDEDELGRRQSQFTRDVERTGTI